jgi:precorrin-8X/cobalt-precorrin-8 methylmutase
MFDRVVVVDWSAGSRPRTGPDSIWIAVADGHSGRITTTNPPTRADAGAELTDICRRAGSTLLGVDFSLGYPAGTAAALGLSGEPWRAMWALLADLVVDGDDNTNNRFRVAAELNARIGGGPGPFWGCPVARRAVTLTSTKVDPAPLRAWRIVEERLRAAGHRPFSAWQLLGAGSVGSQSLVGIPRLARLEHVLRADGRRVEVWPFGGWVGDVPLPDVVIAEVWPSLFRLPALAGRVRDEVQVIETARRLADGVDFGGGPSRFDGSAPIVRSEEGWVLGA